MEDPNITSAVKWSSTAPSYCSNVGRTSALGASRLVELLNNQCPISINSKVLDNGAGAGAVTLAVASNFPGAHVVATDISPSMLTTISAYGLPNVTTHVIDARELSRSLKRGTYSHAFSTFMLQTIRTPLAALREMYDVLSPQGGVGIGVWAKRNGPFEVWERACQSIEPAYQLPNPFDDPNAWRTQQDLEIALERVGFREVSSEEVCIPFPFDGPQAFMEFWFQSNNPAILQIMQSWEKDIDETKQAVEKTVREVYNNGRDINTWAVFGIGKK